MHGLRTCPVANVPILVQEHASRWKNDETEPGEYDHRGTVSHKGDDQRILNHVIQPTKKYAQCMCLVVSWADILYGRIGKTDWTKPDRYDIEDKTGQTSHAGDNRRILKGMQERAHGIPLSLKYAGCMLIARHAC